MSKYYRLCVLWALLTALCACSFNGSDVPVEVYIAPEKSVANDDQYVPPAKYRTDDGKAKEGELLKRYKDNERLIAEYERLKRQEQKKYEQLADEHSSRQEDVTQNQPEKKSEEKTQHNTKTVADEQATGEPVDSENSDDDLALLAELDELEALEDEDYRPELAKGDPVIADPVKYWNVGVFHFNDKLYFWLMKPVSQGYAFVAPKPFRKSVGNVFQNLQFPKRFVNCSLQGRFKPAGEEVGAFVLNSTVGILGIWNPANKWFGWIPENRDFDQTLGKARMPQMMYIVWPVFGPSSVRGTFGIVADTALDGATYISGAGTLNMINSISLGDYDAYETLRTSSLDPYVAVRNAYVQNRIQKVEE